MAVSEEQQYITYTCDGATTAFPVTFTYLKDEYLAVAHYDLTTGYTEILDLNVEYTVVSDEIVTTVTYPLNDKIFITLNVPASQETELLENGQISSELLNFIHDKLTLLSGQLNTGIESSIRLAVPEADALLTIGDSDSRAGTVLGFDEDGDVIATNLADQDLVAVSPAMTPVVGAATLPLARTAMGVADVAAGLPSGGTIGQVPTKQSSTDNDTAWETPSTDATTWDGSTKTVSTSVPSGGSDGDIWFKY